MKWLLLFFMRPGCYTNVPIMGSRCPKFSGFAKGRFVCRKAYKTQMYPGLTSCTMLVS